MESLTQDLKYAIRSLRAKPSFTLVVVLTLMFGIGANTAVFSFVNAILLRPFPYKDQERLVRLQTVHTKTTGNVIGASIDDTTDWQAQNKSFEQIGAYVSFPNTLVIDNSAVSVEMSFVSHEIFSILGVNPILGRTFNAEENTVGGDSKKVILSYELWRSAFGGKESVLGDSIRFRGDAYTVIGVMPAGFKFPQNSLLWVPIMSRYTAYPTPWWKDRDSRMHDIIAKLKPGVSIESAGSDMAVIASRLEQSYPKTNEGVQVRVASLRDVEVGSIRPYLLLLLGAVAMLLLVCCVNVANLVLVKATTRGREIAIRVALGATRLRLVQMLITESLLLSLVGGILGLAVTIPLLKLLTKFIPIELPFWIKFEVDITVLLFNLLLSSLTGVVFGIIPALQVSDEKLQTSLKDSTKGADSGEGNKGLRQSLVVAEVIFSLLLLISAGLMMQSFWKLRQVDAGIKPENLLTVRATRFSIETSREAMTRSSANNYRNIVNKLQTLPGVNFVSAGGDIPYYNKPEERDKDFIAVRGQDQKNEEFHLPVQGADVMPGYFEALGVPLLAGRDFTEADDFGSKPAVIVSKYTAERLWPGRDPIGQEVIWGKEDPDNPWSVVVGVVGDTKWQATEKVKGYELYYSYKQWPTISMYLLVRTSVGTEQISTSIRQAIREVSPDTAIIDIKTMENVISEALWQRRLWGLLFATFATVALLMMCVGIYGVMSYAVSQRTREIGLRMALGAQPLDVLILIISQGLKLVVIGLVVGLVASFATTRLLSSLLFGISANDPITFVVVSVLILLIALIACFIPAKRAAKIQPLEAIRCDS